MQIIGTKKCRETQKTERYFKERKIAYHFVDLSQRELSPGELKSLITTLGADELIDTGSKLYKKRGMEYMDFDAIEELAEHPDLMKIPVVRDGSKAVIGWDPESWKTLLGVE
ncbi:MAG: glutaredoxin [Spirochaetales bacterium]|nr:glutaredoxin [Spirochaetales bacterium]